MGSGNTTAKRCNTAFVFSIVIAMSTSIKEITATQLQEAFAKALSDLTGKVCSVSISELQFEANAFESLTGAESVSFSAKATLKPLESNESVPF